MQHKISRDIFEQVMVPNYSPLPIIPVKGQGSKVWDQSGKEYIDFAGGIAVTALGHCHPTLTQTLHQQVDKLWHLSNVYTNEPALKLAKTLCDKTFADKVYFANSGAEANEAAFKLARKYAYDHDPLDDHSSDKNQIISCINSFHGRTLFTVSVGGQAKYCEGFKPIPAGITHVEFNNTKSLRDAISHKTCAVVLEPIQGEGGIITADPEFLKAARELCDQHSALLIFDEIQTGVGRTGKLFAYEHSGVTPDILTSAKALGGGFPIAAMLCTKAVAQSLNMGSHGSTYGGNPLGCAVANEVLHIIDTPQVLKGVQSKHQLFVEKLHLANQHYPLFKEIRGEGLLIGCELRPEYQGKARQLLQLALEEGVMVLIAGLNVIRLTPSLIIPDEEITQGMKHFEKAMESFIAHEQS
jgi:acetylornithine/N-succinyldiaminopimelate aminotransferase